MTLMCDRLKLNPKPKSIFDIPPHKIVRRYIETYGIEMFATCFAPKIEKPTPEVLAVVKKYAEKYRDQTGKYPDGLWHWGIGKCPQMKEAVVEPTEPEPVQVGQPVMFELEAVKVEAKPKPPKVKKSKGAGEQEMMF